VTILNVNSIAHGLLYAVASDQTIVDSAFAVELEPLDNVDVSRSPWVGLYWGRASLPPGPISAGQVRDVEIELEAIVRVQQAGSRLEAVDALHRALGPVLTAIHCNPTLLGSVGQIMDIAVEPFEVNRAEDDWIQAAHILITAVHQVQ
jgi:hypothetical protein